MTPNSKPQKIRRAGPGGTTVSEAVRRIKKRLGSRLNEKFKKLTGSA